MPESAVIAFRLPFNSTPQVTIPSTILDIWGANLASSHILQRCPFDSRLNETFSHIERSSPHNSSPQKGEVEGECKSTKKPETCQKGLKTLERSGYRSPSALNFPSTTDRR